MPSPPARILEVTDYLTRYESDMTDHKPPAEPSKELNLRTGISVFSSSEVRPLINYGNRLDTVPHQFGHKESYVHIVPHGRAA